MIDTPNELERIRFLLANMTDQVRVQDAEIKELKKPGDQNAERVAFTSGWNMATGCYCREQTWNMERCWNQYQKDKKEEER